MTRMRAFTVIELLVVISTIAVALAVLVPALHQARAEDERVVCLGNHRQLTFAWLSYTDDFDGEIVNGMGGVDREREPAWVGKCWASDYASGGQLPQARQVLAIKHGALYPYLNEMGAYSCPTAYRGQILTYAIMDGMNGAPRGGTQKPGVWVTNRYDIPEPAQRAVFIDEGWVTPGSFAVYYLREQWGDHPPVQHRDGTTLSFADGHADHWQWRGHETAILGRQAAYGQEVANRVPETTEGYDDLHQLQRATWGGLGYEPTEF